MYRNAKEEISEQKNDKADTIREGILKRKIKSNKGITLIALMITIIIILIIVGVTLTLTLGERGIFKTTKNASLITKIKEIEEQAQLSYADKKTEELAGGEKVTIDKIVNDLKEQGYKIVPKTSGANTVDGIELSDKEITMDENSTASLIYTLKYAEGTTQYFAEISGKYYKIVMENDKIMVNMEPSNIEEQEIPPLPTIIVNKENIITVELGENGTIKVTSSESYGEVEITITCEGKIETFTVTVIQPPPEMKPSHSAKDISALYTWEEMAEAAKIISNNDDIIKKDIAEEVKIKFNEKTITIGIGDTMKLNGNNVRILGFNHDELSDVSVYKNEDGKTNKYAGITFEYVNSLFNSKMHSNSNYPYGKSDVRTRLNSTEYDKIKSIANIKMVKKIYGLDMDTTEYGVVNDYLWVLSYYEVCPKGYILSTSNRKSKAPEGTEYLFFSRVVEGRTNLGMTLKTRFEISKWLRTPDYGTQAYMWWSSFEQCSRENGYYSTYGIAPGFCL